MYCKKLKREVAGQKFQEAAVSSLCFFILQPTPGFCKHFPLWTTERIFSGKKTGRRYFPVVFPLWYYNHIY